MAIFLPCEHGRDPVQESGVGKEGVEFIDTGIGQGVIRGPVVVMLETQIQDLDGLASRIRSTPAIVIATSQGKLKE